MPHELTDAQKIKRVNCAQILLDRQNEAPFLANRFWPMKNGSATETRIRMVNGSIQEKSQLEHQKKTSAKRKRCSVSSGPPVELSTGSFLNDKQSILKSIVANRMS